MSARIALICTRRALPAADTFAGNLLSKHVLHDMLASVTAPMHELSTAHIVALEIPTIVTQKFEHQLLVLV